MKKKKKKKRKNWKNFNRDKDQGRMTTRYINDIRFFFFSFLFFFRLLFLSLDRVLQPQRSDSSSGKRSEHEIDARVVARRKQCNGDVTARKLDRPINILKLSRASRGETKA